MQHFLVEKVTKNRMLQYENLKQEKESRGKKKRELEHRTPLKNNSSPSAN